MSVERQNSLADAVGAAAALADLLRPFVPGDFVPDAQPVGPESMSPTARALLAHESHMTTVLERHFGCSVAVRVHEEQRRDDLYTRKIDLVLRGTTRVVEWGVARLNLAYLAPPVRDEILAKKAPLGAILIRHGVHRRVRPRHYLRLEAASRVIALFDRGYNGGPVFGRLATIYCDNEPTIDLLEVVVGIDPKETP